MRTAETTLRLPIFESLTQAASVTGIPLDVLKQAKRDGCPAFINGNRIRLDEFNRWFFSRNGATEKLDYGTEKALLIREQRICQERENKIAEGILAPYPEIESKIFSSLLIPLKQAMDAMPHSIGPQCNPGDPALAISVLESWKESVKKTIREQLPTA